MAERTLSIAIEVDGAQDAAAQVKRVRSALDDLGGGVDGLSSIVRQGREVAQILRDLGTGARSAGDAFKNVWKDVTDYIKGVLRDIGGATGSSRGGSSILSSIGSLLGGFTVGNSNRVISGLGGLGSGALTGLGVAGPIGAVVGGLIGGIAGLFGGGGKEKRHDADIANQGFVQLRQILDDYNHFRRDFASSVDSANRIWAQMQSQWVRPQSAPSQMPFFDAIIRSMQGTEDERSRRRQASSLQPPPEFAEGGLVNSASTNRRSGVLAVVHPGEFVMSQKAVDRWGVSMLEGLNRGSSVAAQGGQGMTISVDPDGSKWLQQNVDALEKGIAVILRRGGAVSRALRA